MWGRGERGQRRWGSCDTMGYESGIGDGSGEYSTVGAGTHGEQEHCAGGGAGEQAQVGRAGGGSGMVLDEVGEGQQEGGCGDSETGDGDSGGGSVRGQRHREWKECDKGGGQKGAVEARLRDKIAVLKEELGKASGSKFWQDRARVVTRGTNKRERVASHEQGKQGRKEAGQEAGAVAGTLAVVGQLRRQLKSRSAEVGTWVTRANLEEEKRKAGEKQLAWKREDLSRTEERLREEEGKRVKCEEEMERLKEIIRDTEGTGGVVRSGEVVGVDIRGGGDNEEGEHSGGTGGEASGSVLKGQRCRRRRPKDAKAG